MGCKALLQVARLPETARNRTKGPRGVHHTPLDLSGPRNGDFSAGARAGFFSRAVDRARGRFLRSGCTGSTAAQAGVSVAGLVQQSAVDKVSPLTR